MADSLDPKAEHHLDEPPTSRAWLLAKNAIANIVRAFSSSAVTVILPVFLVIVLQPRLYAAWALAFSLGAFVVYLDLGVPTTVQAMVGRAMGLSDLRSAQRVTLSGLKVSAAVVSACLLVALVAALAFGLIFPAVPRAIWGSAGVALLIIVGGQGSSLIGNTISAFFAGQQRSFVPTAVLAPARIISMVAALIAAALTENLVWAAVGYALPLVFGMLALLAKFRAEWTETTDEPQAGRGVLEPFEVTALLKYSGPLVIWGVSTLVSTGAGLVLVARFDYAHVVPFSIAAIVVSALAGLESSATAPFLPELARTHELHGRSRVTLHAERLSRVNGGVLFLAVGALLALAPWFLPVLARHAELRVSWPILVVLLIGNAIHLSGTPISLAFIATKTHTKVILPPVIEAATGLIASVGLGLLFGALGVAIGVLVGGCVGIILCFSWSIRLSGVLTISTWQILSRSTIWPSLSIAPVVIAVSLVIANGMEGTATGVVIAAVSFLVCFASLWLLSRDDGRSFIRRGLSEGALSSEV
jgi:O-antigen/teichoic acid export membrane protein